MTKYCTVTYIKNILYIKTEYHLHTIGHIFTTNSVQNTPCTEHNTSVTSFYKQKFRLEFTVLRILANKLDRSCIIYNTENTLSNTGCENGADHYNRDTRIMMQKYKLPEVFHNDTSLYMQISTSVYLSTQIHISINI